MAVIDLYSRVELASDRYEKDGAVKGMLGYVIESHTDEMYEVEFSERDTGITIALIVAHASELVLRPEETQEPQH